MNEEFDLIYNYDYNMIFMQHRHLYKHTQSMCFNKMALPKWPKERVRFQRADSDTDEALFLLFEATSEEIKFCQR